MKSGKKSGTSAMLNKPLCCVTLFMYYENLEKQKKINGTDLEIHN